MKNIKCKCGYMIVERNIQKAYVYYECETNPQQRIMDIDFDLVSRKQ
jgi:hypothetical protein